MQIRSATFLISAPHLDLCPESELPEFAFIGRSNVGKSSLLNMLSGKRDLAMVSTTPGHTKLINFFSINNEWMLVDLPGYGHAKADKNDRYRFQEMIATYLSQRSNLTRVFVLIDGRLSPQQIDLEFVQWLDGCGVPFVLVFTKVDKVKPTALKANIAEFQQEMAAWLVQMPEVFVTSSKDRSGRLELLQLIKKDLDGEK